MDQEIKKILKQNTELTKEIYKMTKKISRFIFWQKVFNILKILIILVPITLGIIYLPPLFKNFTKQYQGFLNIFDINDNIKQDINLKKIQELLHGL
ncbi:MAG: hypothetical protein ABII94_00555 [Patescibacteria group bacterium]|nr:hypothetical protein [Patescibacteria group bacterium]MBU2456633.1 hypothetical protein [Patescibacteria group bacterium]